MKARRHLHPAVDAGDPVLGYEAAIPHLMKPAAHAPPASAAPPTRSSGLAELPLVLGAVLGLGTTSVLLLALVA